MTRLYISLLIASVVTVSFFCVSQSGLAASKSTLLADQNPIIAKVGKKTIRLSEIEDRKINQLRQQLFDLITVKLSQLTVDELAKINREYSKKATTKISDSDVKDFFQKNNLAQRGKLEQLAPQLKLYLAARNNANRYNTLYDKAIKQGLIKTFVQKPKDFLMAVPYANAYTWKSKGAKVMLLEFSDYQCPFCSKVQPTLDRLRKLYQNKVRFAYRHLPLAFHKEADEAANAVECAREQGKFEPYHSILFANQRQQFKADLKKYGKRIKINNLSKFNKCVDRNKYASRVEHDLQTASSLGLNGTPSFIIGTYDVKTKTVTGDVLSGALPESEFVNIIEKFLKITSK